MISFPPGTSSFSNFIIEGKFIAIAAVPSLEISGEPTESSDTTTAQFAVPPLISGP